MNIVVGFDRSESAEGALVEALRMAQELDGVVHIAHVVSQADLDRTGALTFEEKRSAILEQRYPAIWKRVNEIVEEVSAGCPELTLVELQLHLRFAPVHLTKEQRRTAEQLMQVAADYGARYVFLGREGRPGSVAECLLEGGQLHRATGHGRCLVLAARGERIDVPTSASWTSKR